jgi:F-type H+-transporting ATPase subunit gamma
MPTLIDFRRRIRSVRNTQQITRAMKFVAAAKLRRAQDAALAARPYARQMLSVMRSAAARIENPAHPLLARREERRVLVLVVSGDKGLCGAFNTNVVRRAVEFMREHPAQAVEVIPAGKKARDAMRMRRASVFAEYLNISAKVDFSRAREIAGQIIELYSTLRVDAVYCVYNEFKSVLVQRLIVEKLLPLDPAILAPRGAEGGEAGQAAERGRVDVDYIYAQPAEEILGRLLPRHVEAQVFRVLLESSAAEHAARMTAMDAATNNAAELIEHVTLHMNKVRQAGITREIIEVVSGAASTA